VVVVPYGRAVVCTGVAERFAADDWRFTVTPPQQTYGGALNAGAARARGAYLTFPGAADTLAPDAFEALVGSLTASGSDFAVGNVTDAAPAKHLVRSEHGRAHEHEREAVTLADAPDALFDVLECNRMFRR